MVDTSGPARPLSPPPPVESAAPPRDYRHERPQTAADRARDTVYYARPAHHAGCVRAPHAG
ncbi:MAG: hypothetical protein Q9194_007783, partial [Teloschistes cf. exilis]